MEIEGKAFLVAGASGELGSRFARALAARGARVALTARDRSSLDGLAAELDAPAFELEITDPGSRRAALDGAVEALGGIDGLLIATGAVAFGESGELDPQAEERLFAINATGPIGLIGAALPQLSEGGAVVALSAVVAEYPTARMAVYSASKAALSAYLTAIRREQRRRLAVVLEIRPGHMDTGFSDRALAGEPPRMPEPEDADALVDAAIEAMVAERRTLAYDPVERSLSPS